MHDTTNSYECLLTYQLMGMSLNRRQIWAQNIANIWANIECQIWAQNNIYCDIKCRDYN